MNNQDKKDTKQPKFDLGNLLKNVEKELKDSMPLFSNFLTVVEKFQNDSSNDQLKAFLETNSELIDKFQSLIPIQKHANSTKKNGNSKKENEENSKKENENAKKESEHSTTSHVDNSVKEESCNKCCDTSFQLEKTFYRCLTCNIQGLYAICEHCSSTCHHDHELEHVGSGRGNCDCKKFAAHKENTKSINEKENTKHIEEEEIASSDEEFSTDEVDQTSDDEEESVVSDEDEETLDSEEGDISSSDDEESTFSDDESVILNSNTNGPMTFLEALDKDLCTYNTVIPPSEKQILYDCFVCHLFGICRSCAKKCHSGHRISLSKKTLSECGCRNSSICTFSEEKPSKPRKCVSKQCSYDLTGRRYIRQPFYTCYTCSLTGSLGFCAGCIESCHKNHKIHYRGELFAFCDCQLH